MDSDVLKRRWLLWFILEVLVTGGYLFAQSRLPPLLPSLIPAPFQPLGWTVLHAILQLILFFGVLSPLIREHILYLYPDYDEKKAKAAVLITTLPLGLILLPLFLLFSKGDRDGDAPPAFIRRPVVTTLGLGLLLLGSSVFSQSTNPPIADPVLVRAAAFLTMNPTSFYIGNIATSVSRHFDLRKTIRMNPDLQKDPESRLRAYQEFGLASLPNLVILLGVELETLERVRDEMKARIMADTGAKQVPDRDMPAPMLDFCELALTLTERMKSLQNINSELNPVSITGVGAVELALIYGAELKAKSKSLKRLQFVLQKFLEATEGAKPEFASRHESLKKRLEDMTRTP